MVSEERTHHNIHDSTGNTNVINKLLNRSTKIKNSCCSLHDAFMCVGVLFKGVLEYLYSRPNFDFIKQKSGDDSSWKRCLKLFLVEVVIPPG